MPTLVAYSSMHGATQEIAERIAATLGEAGEEADARSVEVVDDLTSYDAFVVGSAVYSRHWQNEASEFVRRNRTVLASRPVWLFSSGPLGTEATDAVGQDLTVAAEPMEIAEFRRTFGPQDHRVFFGALDPGRLGFAERLVRMWPAFRPVLPEGDFRDWAQIEAWARDIGHHLAELRAGPR